MTSRSRLLLLALIAALVAFVAGCGGGGSDEPSADEDTSVDQVLKDTFSGQKKVDSGKLDLSLQPLIAMALVTMALVPISLERPWHYTIVFTTLTLHATIELRAGAPVWRRRPGRGRGTAS